MNQSYCLLGEAAEAHVRGRVIYTGYVDDADLVALFQSATAFVYPSVYEGFGLPPLEAMGVGTPTIVSDIPVMREVVGDAAIRVAPTDVGELMEALARVRSDVALRTRLVREGRARAA